jgi:hypothetical protein
MTTKLATFRVDIQTWEDFQIFARKQGESASSLIVRFIELSLAGSSLNDKEDKNIDYIDDIDAKIEDAVNSKIAWINSTIMDDINEIRASMDNLIKRIDSIDEQAKYIDNMGDTKSHIDSIDIIDGTDQQTKHMDRIDFYLKQIESLEIINPKPKENDVNAIKRRKNLTGKDLPRKVAVALLQRFDDKEKAWGYFQSLN